MFHKYQAIIVILLSLFWAHLVNTAPWIEMGTRQENDQFLFADCAVSNLTDYGNETIISFEYTNVNRTHVRVYGEPGWNVIQYHTWSSSNKLDLTITNHNTTQLAVRINVFGYPTTDNETDVKNVGDNLLSTKHVINNDDYEGNGVHINTHTVMGHS